MPFDRRRFLSSSVALGASSWASAGPLVLTVPSELLPASGQRRVVIVGGGWAGLTAARRLRDLAPDLEVVLLERNPSFWSGALSNRWLAGWVDTGLLVHDYARAAQAYGYRVIQAEVAAVDRERRQVVTSQGRLRYDWLVLATGIRYSFAAWYGDDRQAIEHTLRHYPCAYIPGVEAAALKQKMDRLAGGDLLMTIPPVPYRCPPSPYERACVIGWLLKSRKIGGKLIILDPNPSYGGFDRVFAEQYKDQIVYLPQTPIKAVDPFKRVVITDFDEFRFDDAILMAPQQASDLLWQADLIGRDSMGKPTGWARQDPLHLHAPGDERIFLVGDLMGAVSPLFGAYPKSGHMASALGRIAAGEIAAQARGEAAQRQLPESLCHVFTNLEPKELLRIESRYRVRGDGAIAQTVTQTRDPNPRDEDLHWAKAQFANFLAYRP